MYGDYFIVSYSFLYWLLETKKCTNERCFLLILSFLFLLFLSFLFLLFLSFLFLLFLSSSLPFLLSFWRQVMGFSLSLFPSSLPLPLAFSLSFYLFLLFLFSSSFSFPIPLLNLFIYLDSNYPEGWEFCHMTNSKGDSLFLLSLPLSSSLSSLLSFLFLPVFLFSFLSTSLSLLSPLSLSPPLSLILPPNSYISRGSQGGVSTCWAHRYE